jgi:FtsH-binding integral membrane protein
MLGIYNNMALGLAITGLVAYGAFRWAVSNEAVANALYVSPLKWVIMLAPLAFVFGLSAMVHRMQPGTARLVFLAFAAVMGLSMSSIFIVFTGTSIARTFFVAAATFGALSLWGYTTKRDISGWGSFLFMGLIGLILAMIVNIFLASSALQFAISAIGVLVFAAVMGLSMSSIFIVFTGTSIARTFFVTAASFGALSLWGYTTKRDISGWGSFLFMGVIGLVLASIVNIFLGSSAVQFAISTIGVLVFAGLTAYDTQRLKNTYAYVAGDAVAAGRASIIGALQLYLDFINLFMFLLQFMGSNRE